MKNKLLVFALIVIVFLTFFLGTWIIGLHVTPTWIIATFTIVLAIATFWNGKITQDLLKQTRQAFEIDTFNKIVSSGLQLNAELRDTVNFPQKERPDYVENSIAGMLIALKNNDSAMFKKISEAIKTWNKTDNRTPAIMFSEALEIVEKYQETKKKELT